MGSLKKNRKKRPGSGLQKHKRSIVAITAVIILLCGMVIVHGMALKKSNDAYKVQEEELQTQIDAEKERSEEINKLKKYVGTDEYIEEVAREKLGLVKRTDNPECRRSWVISLTPLGEEKADKVIELFKMADEVFSDGMTAEEVERLYALMDVVEKNIEKHGGKI